ncbi:MAG: penicillin-binding protein 2 [Desulfobacterales bacterium]|nr:MAG: penicillin-binding protein 2 [Desulfobacterales bacterium]
MENKYIKLRILLVGLFFLGALGAIIAKAVHLQVYRSQWLSQIATDQYEKSLTTSGKRGTIYDRNMRELALSGDVTSIAAHPSRVTEVKASAKALAAILKLDARAIKMRLASDRSFVWIKRKTTAKETSLVKDLDLPGIDFIQEYNRYYPNTTLAAQALGFTGLDGEGLEGIEFYYNRQLTGADKNFTVFKDALGNGFSPENRQLATNRGHNLVLTIDSTIQYITENALQRAADQYSAGSALAIVMQPQTGAILAIAHYPTFNPNSYLEYDRSRWRNRAITDPFEPGSTFKIFSAAAALEYGNIKENDIFYCENGAYKIGKNVVHDIRRHGWLSLQQIIKFSSNIGAVKVGEKVGAKRLYQTFRNFGFGEKTGIDCPGETPGSLSHYSSWSNIDIGAISFGHGIAVSAVQLITAVASIANDGVLMQPYIVGSITDQNGLPVKSFKPRQVRRVVSARTAGIVKKIMRTVITEGGTGVNAALDGYSVCGKTGTARKLDENGKYSDNKHVASFVGFTPANHPQIAILVVIDEPKEIFYGGIVAAPVFKDIAQQTLNYLNVAPESDKTKFRVSVGTKANG